MDVLTLGEENYRCIIDRKGRLRYLLFQERVETKVCRIKKNNHKGGMTQLNLHDGRNILLTMRQNLHRDSSNLTTIPRDKSTH